MDSEMNRVQIAAHHWQPRFVANGIDVNDFENVLARTTEWADWGLNWHEMGGVHEALGREAEQHGRTVSATATSLSTQPCATRRSRSTGERCPTSTRPRNGSTSHSRGMSSPVTCAARKA